MADKTLLSDPPAPAEWKGALIKEEHWKPGKSAYKVAHSWSKAQGIPSEIIDLLGNDVTLIGMRPEYEVGMGLGFGRGGVVRCDVFAHVEMDGRTCALVIEAKVDDDFGKNLIDWRKGIKRKPNSIPNRKKRLSKICQNLGVDVPPHDSLLRYQFFSRAIASLRMAECLKTDLAAVIVQSFCDNDSDHDDFLAFCMQFDVQPAVGSASEVVLPGGLPLLLGWARCSFPDGENA